jgi:Putative peptidoglycan binding domain
MGLADRWEGCMHEMSMPNLTEAWDGIEEAIEKLHEIDSSLGGISLAEAVEQLQLMGLELEGVADAAAVTVSWWVGNAVGCAITAAGENMMGAIDTLLSPVDWDWAVAKMNEVNYPVPSIDLPEVEETSTRTSSTAQEDPPPHPVIDQGCDDAESVRDLQRLLVENHGYQIEIDGDFGTATADAVRDFKQRNNLGSSTEVDQYTWRALEMADSPQ